MKNIGKIEKDNIENIGYKFRKEMEARFPGIKNNNQLVYTTLEALGGKIVYKGDLKYSSMDHYSLYIKSFGDFYIRLPEKTDPLRDHFLIMREIGHYLLHCPDKTKSLKVKTSLTEDIQASIFASAFLLPKDEFEKVCVKYKDSLPLIAAHFNLPTDIIVSRMFYYKPL